MEGRQGREGRWKMGNERIGNGCKTVMEGRKEGREEGRKKGKVNKGWDGGKRR